MNVICCVISFFACLLGRLCGMGGGVIMKPVLDAAGTLDAASVNFLSGCTVLGMSGWSVVRSLQRDREALSLKVSTPLAIGAVVGGLLGKKLFALTVSGFAPQITRQIQAGLLLAATALTLLYTVFRQRIPARQTEDWRVGLDIGFALGIAGTFLGIGGGPFNMAALFFFYSMPAKSAAQNSLYIILFSQSAGLLSGLLTGGLPDFPIVLLGGMAVCGVLGSALGSVLSDKLKESTSTRLFEAAMLLVAGICVYNLCAA